MAATPKVSILCLAYNQRKYIRQAIDSFLMQETNFPFEVLINDDCSTDGTTEIINEYAKKYPGIIRPIIQKENQYSQGKRNFFIRFLLPKVKGQFIALCEGDDYWTDPLKLQKQVDFLEKNKEYAICFHPVRVFFENAEEEDRIYPEVKANFTVEELLKRNFIQTNSVMYRKQKYDNMAIDVMPGDWYLHLYHSQFGKIGFIDEVMSAYRRHEGGIWWNKKAVWNNYGDMHMRLYEELIKMFGKNPDSRTAIVKNIITAIDHMSDYSERHLVPSSAIKDYPYLIALSFERYRQELKDIKDKANNLGMEKQKISNEKNKKNRFSVDRKS